MESLYLVVSKVFIFYSQHNWVLPEVCAIFEQRFQISVKLILLLRNLSLVSMKSSEKHLKEKYPTFLLL